MFCERFGGCSACTATASADACSAAISLRKPATRCSISGTLSGAVAALGEGGCSRSTMAGPRGAPLTRARRSLRRYGGYASVRDPATRSENIMEIPLIVLYHLRPRHPARLPRQHPELELRGGAHRQAHRKKRRHDVPRAAPVEQEARQVCKKYFTSPRARTRSIPLSSMRSATARVCAPSISLCK